MLHAPRLPFSVDALIAEAKRRARRRYALLALGLLVVAGAAVATTLALRPGSGPGGGVVGTLPAHVNVTPSGAIGSLQLGVSNRADVIAFAGKPSAEVHGRIASILPAVDALFYGCHARPRDVSRGYSSNGSTPCSTIFWVSSRTGRLSDFWTSDARFADPNGVHAGMTTAAADRVSSRPATFGCGGASIGASTAHTFFRWEVAGAKVGPAPELRALGGHVTEFWLALSPDMAEVLNC